MDELWKFLKTQKYPSKIIENGIERALKLDKQTLRQVKEQPDHKNIPFVSTYNPKVQDFFTKIRPNLNILEDNEKMNFLLQRYQIIKSKRQPANLRKL